ncbi:MAG: hypothetical protein HC911_01190 [Chloroflexaceae bacterium]|nr:hypothetical protein [Chloroflexaceae bacterium]
MSSLISIANKAPIVATFDTQMLHASVTTVRDVYAFHALTYVEQPIVADLRQRFVQAVRQAQTPKACIVAPFGYGKTATAIGIWDACQQAGLLAVPPISCGSFAALAQALYDWAVFMLPAYCTELDDAYDTFLTVSADAMARRDEQTFQIPFEQARASIRDKIERGYLDFDDISVNLVAFLELVTRLTQRAGHQGLVVVVDEIQQLIGNANKGVLVALRQLIWGLRTRQIPFGIVFTMDPDTERILADRAGDILHRIKDDRLYLDMRHIYDRDFPARLWQQYVTAFQLSEDEAAAIDRPALESLGQLCEREDLSNGPRTVINVLQCVAIRAADRMGSYTPIDLVNDFLNGTIRFDGDRGVIPALVGELLSLPYFQHSYPLAQVLRLIAAFPRGCPVEIASRYDLAHAWHELNNTLRGEIVTELEEGLTLIELQRVGRPAHRLNVLLRRYWMQITDQQLFAETAQKIFSSLVLPLIFPPRVHDLHGWKGLDDVLLDADDRYAGMLEGTASSRYPLRRLRVVVMADSTPAPLLRPADDADLVLGFRIDLRTEAVSRIDIVSDTYIVFHLALNRAADNGLRGGLAWIEHYLSPQPISAAVILSLLNYLRQEQIDDAPDRDRARITDTIARLQEWLLADLFPQSLFSQTPFGVLAAGTSGLKEFLHQIFASRWPDYQPIATYQHWMALLDDYAAALRHVAPAQRVGSTVQKGSKGNIAALFRQKRHAGFKSRARQYGDLLRIEQWTGTEAAVYFTPHPAEVVLANRVRTDGALTWNDAYQSLRSQGFAVAEARYVLQLMLARAIVKQEGSLLVSTDVPTDLEIRTQVQNLLERCTQLVSVPDELTIKLNALIETPDQSTNHSQLVWDVQLIEQQLETYETLCHAEAEARHQAARQRVLDTIPRLTLNAPDAPLGKLQHHITAVYRELEEKRQKLLAEATFLMASGNACSPEHVEVLVSHVNQWDTSAHQYGRWNAFAPRLARLQTAVQRMVKGTDNLDALSSQLDQVLRDARAVLSQTGMVALGEISRFEPVLEHCEQVFQGMTDERQAAYEQIASQLCTQIQELLTFVNPPEPPPYYIEDDERSFQALFQHLADIVSRTIALKGLLFVQTESANKAHATHKVYGKIQSVAQQAADPSWLFEEKPPRLRHEAKRSVQDLQQQIARASQKVSSARQYLVRSLSLSSAASVNVAMILEQAARQNESAQILEELIQLQQVGALSLKIEF